MGTTFEIAGRAARRDAPSSRLLDGLQRLGRTTVDNAVAADLEHLPDVVHVTLTRFAVVFGPLLALAATGMQVPALRDSTPALAWGYAAFVTATLLLPVPRVLRKQDARRPLLAAVGLFALGLGVASLAPAAGLVAPVPMLVVVTPVLIGYFAVASRGLVAPVVSAVAISITLALLVLERAPSPLALLDGGTVAVIGLASIAVVRILRRRTARADAARSAAVRRYSTLRLDEAMEAERVRTDALLHDSVLTTLLSASAAATPDAEALAARMAGNALRIISEQTSSALSDTLVPFAAAIAAAGPRLMPASELVDFHLADAAGVLVPEAVGEALVSATRQAVANSVKHAGPFAARIVRATPWGADGIRVTIRDDGRGFDVAAIPVERLGVRVSIVERVRRVGGHAEIRSAPGRGTTVVLTWPAAAAQRSEEAVPDRAAVPA